MDVILGVDGGGTKTNIVAIDMLGDKIAFATGKSINYNFITMKDAVKNFLNAIKALSLPKEVNIKAISIGNPSIDDVTEDENSNIFIREILKEFKDTQIYMKSDAFMALYGLTKGDVGVLIISGTGSMGIGIDKGKNLHVVGGWGRPTLDNGSGYCIGVLGINAAFDAYDKVGKDTFLVNALCDFFEVKNLRDVIPLLNSDKIEKSDIARFAIEVSKGAARGDEVSLDIIEHAANKLSDYAISLIRSIDEEELVVGIYGGVFLNNDFIREKFTQRVKEKYPKGEIKIPDIKPEMSAAIYALGEIKNG